ncbi:hypothetical protein KIH74_05870 [Kineosporia sp. J2-2]|uniref:DUF7455 domain-containing protein n=1 Tax=Kineosporia corallincola TaxID=2835133 RepID=A0ABS5TBI1_9ACTN|nr:hypothetical protein [Kineosporia corallincola]MBT0768442.1 hypothetical protein [Kineosporia corallincola]
MTASATEVQAPTIPTAFQDIPALTATDRCDATTTTIREGSGTANPRVPCGAQAYVTALFPSGSVLLFCGHHGHELECSLVEQGAVIRDDSNVLQQNTKPGASA